MKIIKHGKPRETYIGKIYICMCECQFEIESCFDVREGINGIGAESYKYQYAECPDCKNEVRL